MTTRPDLPELPPVPEPAPVEAAPLALVPLPHPGALLAVAPAPLRQTRERHLAYDWSLVLCAEGIAHELEPDPADLPSWWLVVDDSLRERAEASLRAWEQENRAQPEPVVRQWEGGSPGPWLAALCVVGQLATGPRDESLLWFARGTADASAILHGELWRCLTALTLHADLEHAFGNAVCGWILLDALTRRVGPAWSVWLALAAGFFGNWLTALSVHGDHLSIGASTSVFGVLGALTLVQLLRRERRALLTVGAGVALLALLGTSPRSDLFAHLYGALVGCAGGAIAGLLQREAPGHSLADTGGRTAQLRAHSAGRIVPLALALLGLAPLIWAWSLALR